MAMLRRLYVLNITVVAVVLFLLWFEASRYPTPSGSLKLARVFALGVAGIHLLFLPVTYVRTIKPTMANEIVVRVLDAEGSSSSSEHGFFIDVRESELVMYHKTEGHIWFVPAGRIERLFVEQSSDMLAHHFRRVVHSRAISPPPPAF